MKSVFIALLYLFLLCADSFGFGVPVVVTSGTSGSSAFDTTNVTLWYNAETFDFTSANGTTEYSAGDVVGTQNSSVPLNTTATCTGNSIYVAAGGDNVEFDPAGIIDGTEFNLGFLVNGVSVSTNGRELFTLTESASNKIKAFINADGSIEFYWTGNSVAATTITSSAGTFATDSTCHWFEFRANATTNYREIFVDGVSKGSSSDPITAFSSSATVLKLGDVNYGGDAIYGLDHVIITTDSSTSTLSASTQVNYDGS